MNFLSDLYLNGQLYLNDASSDNTTLDSLFITSGDKVVKRTIGSLAFESTDNYLNIVESDERYLKQVGLSLPNIFNVAGSPATPGSTTITASLVSQTKNTFFAAPENFNGTPSFRAITLNDLPDLRSHIINDASIATGTTWSSWFIDQKFQSLVSDGAIINNTNLLSVNYTGIGGEFSFTKNELVTRNIGLVMRSGIGYQIIGSGTPTEQQVLYNKTTGTLTFSRTLYTGEPVTVLYGIGGASGDTDGSIFDAFVPISGDTNIYNVKTFKDTLQVANKLNVGDKIAANPAHAERNFNVLGTSAVLRIGRYTDTPATQSPSVELISYSLDGSNRRFFWDYFIGADNSFSIRNRTNSDLIVAKFTPNGTIQIPNAPSTTSGNQYSLLARNNATGDIEVTSGAAFNYEKVIASGTTTQYWRGDKTWQTLNTSAVTENGNLYFTKGRVLSTDLSGYTVGSNTVLSTTDTVLTAFGKIQSQLNTQGINTATAEAVKGIFGEYSVHVKESSPVQYGYFKSGEAPTGWVECKGQMQLLSTATYPNLFAEFGSTYGGDGRDTFAVPYYDTTASSFELSSLLRHLIGKENGVGNSDLWVNPTNPVTFSLLRINEPAPSGWLKCDGSILDIVNYPDLYSVIGTTYGGNGQTTFALPTNDVLDIVPTNLNQLTTRNASDLTEDSTHRFVTDTEKSNWNSAYGWGNHASAGYALNTNVLHKTGDEIKSGHLTLVDKLKFSTTQPSTWKPEIYWDELSESVTIGNEMGDDVDPVHLSVPSGFLSSKGFDTSDNQNVLNIRPDGISFIESGIVGKLLSGNLTATRNWTLPDATGTIALTSDIPTLQRVEEKFTSTANQTIFNTSQNYSNSVIDVFINGVRLNSSDFSVSGSTITLNEATIVGQMIDVVVYRNAVTGSTEPSNGTMFTHTASGDGVKKSFTVAHGLSYTPTMVMVTPNTANANGVFSYVNGANIVIESSNAFTSGTDNLKWTILVK